MPYPSFHFLTALPTLANTVPCLQQVQVFTALEQSLLLGYCDFSVTAYRPTDFAQLQLDYPVQLQQSVVKRQAEYLAGRYLCRVLLKHSGLFGNQPPQIATGLLRAPAWPAGITGSITHHQHSASVLILTGPSSASYFAGIDTELWLDEAQAEQIAASVHKPTERKILCAAGFSPAQATTLLFSAKEALFKAICSFVGEYFGFEAAELVDCGITVTTDAGVVSGWLEFRLSSSRVLAKAPQQYYRCWFHCSATAVFNMVCSDAINAQLQPA